MGLADMVRQVDAFPKTLEEFRVRTSSGAAVSLCAMLCMVLLFFSEVGYYMTKDVNEIMEVDHTRGEKLRINFDITFPQMACSVVHLDAMDISGKHQNDVDHNVVKIRLDKNGKRFGSLANNQLKQTITTPDELLAFAKDKDAPKEKEDSGGSGDGSDTGSSDGSKASGQNATDCGSCYGAGAEGQCCTTCDEIRELYRKKGWAFKPSGMAPCQREGFMESVKANRGEGCNMRGYLEVPKVGGNFHFAPGRSFQQAHSHVHDLMKFTLDEFNITHRINSLSFGRRYPDMANPLDGYNITMGDTSGMYQYYMQVVPTDYNYANGRKLLTNQFSVTDHMRKLDSRSGRGLPGVFFFYDISPIRVRIEEKRRSFLSFLTSVCAIIGGVFTVMGLVDKAVYRVLQRAKSGGASGVLKSF